MYDGFIYETTCKENNMKYRGQHKRSHANPEDPDDSWYIGSPTNPQFWEDLEKYGREAFVREIIQDGPFDSLEHISRVETRRLKEVDAANNPQYYNKSNWGGVRDQNGENNPMYGKTWKMPIESREKISESLRGKSKSPEAREHMSENRRGKCTGSNNFMYNNPINKGENHPNYGKSLRESTKNLISSSLKGRKLSEETRTRISKSNSNPSIERRRQMSESKRGENNPMYGKRHSEDTRKKISESLKGISYQVKCYKCSKEFIGTSPRSRICPECKGVM